MIHLDSTFVVDLCREAHGVESGPASLKLEELRHEDLWVSVFVACEMQVGVELSHRLAAELAVVNNILASLQVVPITEAFPPTYGRLRAAMRRRGETIGTMDLLIATCAVIESSALITRNAKNFERVPELQLIHY